MGRIQEHSKLKVVINLKVYLKLWLPLDLNKGGPIFRKVPVTIDLEETRHKSIRLPNNTIRNSANSFYFFVIFLSVRSTKGVTTKNLSLNKWNTWPVEFSEVSEKWEKKLHDVKTQILEVNLEVLKFSNPPMEGIDRSKKFFWSILIYGTLNSEFVCESYGYFTIGLWIIGQNGPKVEKICGGG